MNITGVHSRKGRKAPLFMLVKTGRHENPDLRRDQRKTQTKAAEHADPHLGEENFRQRGIDQMIGGGVQRLDQKIEDRRGEGEADHKTDRQRRAIAQTSRLAQLQQMLHQRRAGGVESRLVFRGRIGHGSITRAARWLS